MRLNKIILTLLLVLSPSIVLGIEPKCERFKTKEKTVLRCIDEYAVCYYDHRFINTPFCIKKHD